MCLMEVMTSRLVHVTHSSQSLARLWNEKYCYTYPSGYTRAPKRRWISVSWSIDSLSARYALHPLACIAIDGGHRRVIRSRESESVKDCSWIENNPLSARYALNIPPQYLCSHSWHKTYVKGGSSQRESGWCTLASSNSVSMLPWLITLDPHSARYALITELGKTLKREILPLPQEFEVGTSCPKECRVLGFDQAKCHCYGIMPSNARYAL